MDLALGHTCTILDECERHGLPRKQAAHVPATAFWKTALAPLLAGSTTARSSFRDIADPVRLSRQGVDALSDGEVAFALAHNKKGEKPGGWKL